MKSLSNIKPKYEVVGINNIEVMIDISLVQNTDELYFNASLMARQFDKKTDDFLRLQSTKEYVDEIIEDSQVGNSRLENLIRITHGGKYRGTWLHKELAYEFAGWLSPIFRRNLHKWVEQRLKDEHQSLQNRLTLKTDFLPLTNAIQSAHEDPKFYHFSNECDLINRLVTGMSAKQFKKIHGLDNVRDGLTAAESQLMTKLQIQNTTLIEIGFSYDERKGLLSKQVCISFDLIGKAA